MPVYMLSALLFNIAALRWGDWRNLSRYYPTILFMIAASLFYESSCYEYPLWQFKPQKTLVHNVTIISILINFGIFPATVLLFLSRFPNTLLKQIGYTLLWSVGYILGEYACLLVNLIEYHNGWHFGWSILFDLLMFPILRLHHIRPLGGWIATVIFAIFLWNVFDIPLIAEH